MIVEDDQILGAPARLTPEIYEIEAEVDSSEVTGLSNLSGHQRQLMFRQLLADRFDVRSTPR